MKERKADLFETIYEDSVDAICITTNGNYSSISGLAFMVDDCASICAKRWKDIPQRLGKMLKMFKSNVPFVIGILDENGDSLELTKDIIKNKNFKCLIFSYPTVNNLIDGYNIQLIKQSAVAMVDYANKFDLKNIVIPRIQFNELNWADIKFEIENILDDRFTIVYL